VEFNVSFLIKDISERLNVICEDLVLAKQEAWWFLEKITEKSQVQIALLDKLELSPSQIASLNDWINQRVNEKKPIQYILGYVPFCDSMINVVPPILIPRPETEEWVSWLIGKITAIKTISYTPLNILDLCCGSGCIAIALAKKFSQFKIMGSDINPKAIKLSLENKVLNKIENVDFVQSDLFNIFQKNGLKFDLIVSNPPYISLDKWKDLDESVKFWEDEKALIAENDGLKIYEQIIKSLKFYLKEDSPLKKYNIPQVVLEIGHKQGNLVKNLLLEDGFCLVEVHKDLEGKDRWVCANLS